MKYVVNILLIGTMIGYIMWSWGQNQVDPVINDTRVEAIVDDWKNDMRSIGINGDEMICYLDQITIVDQIPEGPLDQIDPNQVGKSDTGNRAIWILNREYSYAYLKALVYHEIGHYMFDLHHKGTGLIMSSHIVEEPGYYESNWDSILPIYLEKCKSAR